ncbi:MAG: hypothetical protein AAF378_15880 [Cyanobacteria bacterium P01_A01_bin.84]
MRTISQPVRGQVGYTVSGGHSPTVPISVYRDLAAELQAAQAKLDALANQNQQLVQENQQLRQEIGKAIQSVLQLQNFAEPPKHSSNPQSRYTQSPRNLNERTETVPRIKRNNPQLKTPRPRSIPEPILVEEQEVRYYRSRPREVSAGNGWFLAIAILLIIFAAFGAGYLIVRPLLGLQNR